MKIATAAAKEFSKIAKENVEAEEISGTIYGFGSEIACLRLFYAYKAGRVEFSKNLNTWFYTGE